MKNNFHTICSILKDQKIFDLENTEKALSLVVNEKKKGIDVVVIGHVDHGKTTLTAALTQLQMKRNITLVDSPVKGDFKEMEKPIPYKPFEFPAISFVDFPEKRNWITDGVPKNHKKRKR